jgi:hypothetical protein
VQAPAGHIGEYTQVNFPTRPLPEPSGSLTFDGNGALYFADTSNHRIRRLEFSSSDFKQGIVTTIAGIGLAGDSGDGGRSTDAEINFPEDIELGPDGNLYFADTSKDVPETSRATVPGHWRPWPTTASSIGHGVSSLIGHVSRRPYRLGSRSVVKCVADWRHGCCSKSHSSNQNARGANTGHQEGGGFYGLRMK